jgi:hypothetical protein
MAAPTLSPLTDPTVQISTQRVLLPRQFLPASSATEPLPPDFADRPIELPEAPGVRRTSVILVVASEHGIEGLQLLVHRLMAVLPAPFGILGQRVDSFRISDYSPRTSFPIPRTSFLLETEIVRMDPPPVYRCGLRFASSPITSGPMMSPSF